MVRAVCDEVMVLYAGRQMETGSRAAMAEAPWHPYSELLIASVPELRPGWLEAAGEVRAPEMAPGAARPACPFFPRCGQRIDGVCDREPLPRSEEHTSELQSHSDLVCRLLLEKKKSKNSDALRPRVGCAIRSSRVPIN